jgi:VanZ family protein
LSSTFSQPFIARAWHKRRWFQRVGLALHAVATVAIIGFVTWSVLSPDPYAMVRDSSWQWIERSSDLVLHLAAFSMVSLAVLSLSLSALNDLPRSLLHGLLAYCVAMEVLQAFVPGRMCDPRDAVANGTGFLLAFILLRRLRRAPAVPV